MKRTILILLAVIMSLVTVSVCAADDKDSEGAVIEFAEKKYDFGTVSADAKPVVHEFEFTNTGTSPLLIVSASASCGCTRPKYTTEPVKPGKTGKIKVTFLPAGQKGYVSKDIKVRTNDRRHRRVTLKITGNVIPADKK